MQDYQTLVSTLVQRRRALEAAQAAVDRAVKALNDATTAEATAFQAVQNAIATDTKTP